jgi:hypothetical protein
MLGLTGPLAAVSPSLLTELLLPTASIDATLSPLWDVPEATATSQQGGVALLGDIKGRQRSLTTFTLVVIATTIIPIAIITITIRWVGMCYRKTSANS